MKVAIVGGGWDYHSMFEEMGWTVVYDTRTADLIQFTGGADVEPTLYGEDTLHPRTFFSEKRDEKERKIFETFLDKVPMAGICRGGQFLNVMNGGRMVQHCDNHGIAGTHEVIDVATRGVYNVTSTHHQMMLPGSEASLLAYADAISTIKEGARGGEIYNHPVPSFDTEVLLYEHSRCLCFQPHPEFRGYSECRKLYFSYLEKLMELK